MDLDERLEALLRATEEVGIALRREALGGEGGGLCKLKGQTILFVDTMASVDDRYERTLAALAPRTDIDQRYLPPAVREDLERHRR